MLPNGVKGIYDHNTWNALPDKINNFPLFTGQDFLTNAVFSTTLNFIRLSTSELSGSILDKLNVTPHCVVILHTENAHSAADMRNCFFYVINQQVNVPVVLNYNYNTLDEEEFMLHAATDNGSLLIDGFGDGIMIADQYIKPVRVNDISFGVLQAARARISKTEYISCPSCGRTLFDLQETTAMIRRQTDHLKGVKIAIMGCIVNGPGEMADADYGYVGSGVGKITLYRGREVVKKGIEKETAVAELINIIKSDGKWLEKAL